MKNIFLLTLFATFFYFTGCRQKSKAFEERNTTEKLEYKAMSAQQKTQFKNKLIASLKSDSVFVKVKTLMLSQTIYRDKRENAFNEGKNKLQLIMKFASVVKNHPELSKVDKATRIEIMKAEAN